MRGLRPARATTAVAAVLVLAGFLVPGGAKAADPVTERASAASDGSQAVGGVSQFPALSADGRFVAFESAATNLVPGDTNGFSDVFLKDRRTGLVERISVASDGTQGTGASTAPSITPDARFVAFTSGAPNLVGGDTNVTTDVFVRDRQTSTTTRVSVANDGTQGNGASSTASPTSLSDDGRFVTFQSAASTLVPNDTNAATSALDVFVRDRTNNTTQRVSVTSTGAQATSGATFPSISGNGLFVGFSSTSNDLVLNDTNNASDVFVHNRSTATTERVSTAPDGSQGSLASGANSGPALSADGRFVAFESSASNLVSPDTNVTNDVFRKDRVTGAVIRASQRSDGTEGFNASAGPSQGKVVMTPDGRFIGFPSQAQNLVQGDDNGLVDIFVHDASRRQTVRVNVSSQANATSANPALAAYGPIAGFDSAATNLVPGDSNGVNDVFVRPFQKSTGYFVLDNLGGIFTFGPGATFRGSVPALRAAGTPVGSAPIVDLEVTPTGNGYYVLDEAGGISTFGDAVFINSIPGLRAAGASIGNARVIDMAVTPSGLGYLVLDESGGIFAFGDAVFFGSIPQLRAAGLPIGSAQGVDLSITPSGRGYLVLDSLGGIFTFGDAVFGGSLPGLRTAGVAIGDAPAIRLAATPSGLGYIVLDNVGGMFAFGDARFFGSIPGLRNANVPVGDALGVDLAISPTGNGYLILDQVGGIFTFGDGEFFGSIPQLKNQGVAVGPNRSIRVDLVSSMVGG